MIKNNVSGIDDTKLNSLKDRFLRIYKKIMQTNLNFIHMQKKPLKI